MRGPGRRIPPVPRTRHPHRSQPEGPADADHQPPDGRMQMHVLVCVRVIEPKSRLRIGRELRLYLGRELLPHPGLGKIPDPQPCLIRRKPSARIDEIGNPRLRQNRRPFDHHQMQPDPQPGQSPRPPHRIRRRRAGHHQARRPQHPLPIGALDRLVHPFGKPEIIGCQEDAPHRADQAALWRSRRKWKNSTPSRRRRTIISGLLTISPTMAAIFGARK